MLLGLMIEVLGWEMGAFRTNDRGFRMGNGSSLFALLIIVKNLHYCVAFTLD